MTRARAAGRQPPRPGGGVYYVYMQLVLDTDALVKLVMAGAKEAVVGSFEVLIPASVHREAVEEGHGHVDADLISANVGAGRIRVVSDLPERPEEAILPQGGERDAYRLFMHLADHEPAALASDDHRFLRRLRGLGLAPLTPGAVLVLLADRGDANRHEALAFLERLRPHIRVEQYVLCQSALTREGRES